MLSLLIFGAFFLLPLMVDKTRKFRCKCPWGNCPHRVLVKNTFCNYCGSMGCGCRCMCSCSCSDSQLWSAKDITFPSMEDLLEHVARVAVPRAWRCRLGGVDRRGKAGWHGSRLFCGLHGLALVAAYVAPAFFFGASLLRCSSALGLWPPRFCRASGWGACCLFSRWKRVRCPRAIVNRTL